MPERSKILVVRDHRFTCILEHRSQDQDPGYIEHYRVKVYKTHGSALLNMSNGITVGARYRADANQTNRYDDGSPMHLLLETIERENQRFRAVLNRT